MITDLQVKVGPQFYTCHEGALNLIPDRLTDYHAERVLFIHGKISWEKAQPFLKPVLDDYHFTFYDVEFGGECTFKEANALAQLIHEKDIDFIIGVGGGKVCDTTLETAAVANKPFGIVPTLASNCAPWTPISVMYKEDHTSEGISEHHDRQASFLLIDPKLILDSPVRYFIAGIADTMAKWYESDAILSQEEYQDEPMLQMARKATEICRTNMLENAEDAIADMKAGKVSDNFVHIVEIIIAISGMVGGLANQYARVTLAHAIHDSLSAKVPAIHNYLHGEIVAYGIFFQLAMEDKWDEIDALIPFYDKLNLPKSLDDMGAWPLSDSQIDEIIAMTNGRSQCHTLPYPVNEVNLKEALIKLEEYMAQKK